MLVDDEGRVDGVPLVALLTRGHEAALVAPLAVEPVGTHQADGGGVLAERRAAVGQPPAVVPADDVGRPDMVAETGNGVLRPRGNVLDEGCGLYHPRAAVFRRGPLQAHAGGQQVVGALLVGHDRVMDHHRVCDEGHAAVVGAVAVALGLGHDLGGVACRHTEQEEQKS